MTTKHTPGPWLACEGDDCAALRARGERIYFPHVHFGERDCGRSRPARYMTVNEGDSLAQCDANARLIAAAPDLLAALKSMVDDHAKHSANPKVIAARAAIAKAEGRDD